MNDLANDEVAGKGMYGHERIVKDLAVSWFIMSEYLLEQVDNLTYKDGHTAFHLDGV